MPSGKAIQVLCLVGVSVMGLAMPAVAARPAARAQQNVPPPPPPPPPPPSAPAPKDLDRTVKVAEKVQQGKLIKGAPPAYPQAAQKAGVQGTVVLRAIIGKDGLVTKLDVVSGPMQLRQAALDAVRQWRYVPTLVDGDVVAVDTTVSVVFQLGNAK